MSYYHQFTCVFLCVFTDDPVAFLDIQASRHQEGGPAVGWLDTRAALPTLLVTGAPQGRSPICLHRAAEGLLLPVVDSGGAGQQTGYQADGTGAIHHLSHERNA